MKTLSIRSFFLSPVNVAAAFLSISVVSTLGGTQSTDSNNRSLNGGKTNKRMRHFKALRFFQLDGWMAAMKKTR